MKQNVLIVALAAVVFVVVSAGASWDRSMDHDQHRSADQRSGDPGGDPCEGWPYTMSIFDDTPQLLEVEACLALAPNFDDRYELDLTGDGIIDHLSLGGASAGGPPDGDTIEGRPVFLIASESPGQLRQYVLLDYLTVFPMGNDPDDVFMVRPVGLFDVTDDGMSDLVVYAQTSGGPYSYYYFENILTPPLAYCDEDVNEDGQIAVDDVLAVISAWGQNCL